MAKDVRERVRHHNETARGAKYTRSRRPVELVYESGEMDYRSASRLEIKIKQMSRAKKELLCARGGS